MGYEANWNSLSTYTVPDWFKDAKFGIFIHWGPFSVPAFGGSRENESMGNGVWYQYWMYRPGSEQYTHHVANWGDPGRFGYKDFVPLFKGENFDPAQWVEAFKRAGAQYVVPVADYHDGFPMFDCSYSGSWTAVHKGPKRDVVGELEKETRKAGLKFGASSHRAYNWHWYPYSYDFDTLDPDARELYGRPHHRDEPPSQEFLDNWRNRTQELVEKYDLDLIWFDFGWEYDAFDTLRPEFLAWYYNRAEKAGKEVVVQSKGEIPKHIAVLDVERGGLEELEPEFWQTDTSVSKKTWCYDIDDEYKSPKQIIDQLVDVVSKNGGLLLNIGPRPDGTIPEEQLTMLDEIGDWLQVNGEAIYGTRPWYRFGEGDAKWFDQDADKAASFGAFSDADTPEMDESMVRYTTKGEALYAIVMGWPEDSKFHFRYLHEGSPYAPQQIKSVQLVGSDQPVEWVRSATGLDLVVAKKPKGKYAYAFEITFSSAL